MPEFIVPMLNTVCRRAIVAILVFAAAGCGLLGTTPKAAQDEAWKSEAGKPVVEQPDAAVQPAAPVEKAPALPLPPVPTHTNVELVWQVPEDPVDGFVVRYGFQRGSLEHEIKVTTAQLERYEDPSYGFVYRYILKEVPSDESVFISIAAFKGAVVSQAGDVFEVKP